jgi:signal transduction histidine kinase
LGRLTTSLAHEINNPLQATLNFLHLSLDYAVDEAKRREYLEIAREETQRLANLVNTMLDFYRPTVAAGVGIDVNTVIERVLALARKKLQSSSIQVELNLASKLPQVSGAPDQLAQVFLNLVVNAAEAMGAGGRLVIETRPGKRKQWVEVSFTDNGPGIAAADLPHIFEPFYTTKQAGLGLGLSVSYGIVEAQGGTITASSLQGKGSVFTVRLPLVARPQRRPRRKK